MKTQSLYSSCDLIPVSQVFATAKMKLGIDNFDNDLMWEVEIQNLLRRLKVISTSEPLRVLTEVCDYKIKLPRGFKQLFGVCFSNTECDDETTGDTQVSIPPLVLCRPLAGRYGCGCCDDFLRIENGFIHVRLPDQECVMTYEGLHLDDEGNILIYEDYEYMCAMWLCHSFLESNPKYYGDFYATDRKCKEYYNKYLAAKNGLRGAEQRQQWKNDRAEMTRLFDRVTINNYEAYFGWNGGLVNG